MKKLLLLLLLTGCTQAATAQRLFVNASATDPDKGELALRFFFEQPGTVYCFQGEKIIRKIGPFQGDKHFELQLAGRTWGHYIDYERNCIILVFGSHNGLLPVSHYQQLIDRRLEQGPKRI